MLQVGRINLKPQKIGSLAMKSCKETKASSNAARARAPPPSHGLPDFLRPGTAGQINLAGGQSAARAKKSETLLDVLRFRRRLLRIRLIAHEHGKNRNGNCSFCQVVDVLGHCADSRLSEQLLSTKRVRH
jgi:hypothetical protein